MEVSPSVLSSYLNGKTKLSITNAYKIVKQLRLNEDESRYFFNLIILENMEDSKLKTQLIKELDNESQENWPDLQPEVYSYFDALEVDQEYRYCFRDKSRFRILTLYRDPKTKKRVSSFTDRFFASDWKVGGTGYFLDNFDGSFRSYLERGMTRKLELVVMSNTRLPVSFSSQGFPIIKNFTYVFQHEPFHMKGTLEFSEEKVLITGKKIPFDASTNSASDYTGYYDRIY